MSNWGEVGFCNFKTGLEKLWLHEESSQHSTSLAKWKSFYNRLSHGKKLLLIPNFNKQLVKEREKTLKFLDRIFSATLFLALHEIAFRGDRLEDQEDFFEGFGYSGNYLELLKLIARNNNAIMEVNLGSKKYRWKYTSRYIKNEIISSIARVT